ncbi:hypothetical protein RE6C_03896 [Rhodopirellula europaea 6C]|uniref:Uncharacterized protein n=1 Tax=Rhodopirellula europaea 6C TaxID=1263867 RepID=M2AZG8_9BACT|nr:hypothetical protein RE6C_03896 [Rhodopirellula europaea 6C]
MNERLYARPPDLYSQEKKFLCRWGRLELKKAGKDCILRVGVHMIAYRHKELFSKRGGFSGF